MTGEGLTAWLTGLSCSGKTTISGIVADRLLRLGRKVEVLDGDAVRLTLSRGLGFSREDRDENIRRIGFVANILTRNGVIVVVAAISPYRAVRDEMRRLIGAFIEVHVDAPLEVCERRDRKGMYRRARNHEVTEFTGVSAPYEPPIAPDVHCRTDKETPDESALKVLRAIGERTGIPAFADPGDP